MVEARTASEEAGKPARSTAEMSTPVVAVSTVEGTTAECSGAVKQNMVKNMESIKLMRLLLTLVTFDLKLRIN